MVNKNTNICDNVVIWNGNPDTWTPPADYLMLVQATTPAKVWEYDSVTKTWNLGIQVGAGQINFTWDGMYLITNEPQPVIPVQPEVEGAQTL